MLLFVQTNIDAGRGELCIKQEHFPGHSCTSSLFMLLATPVTQTSSISYQTISISTTVWYCTHGSIVILIAVIFLSLCLLSAALTENEKHEVIIHMFPTWCFHQCVDGFTLWQSMWNSIGCNETLEQNNYWQLIDYIDFFITCYWLVFGCFVRFSVNFVRF